MSSDTTTRSAGVALWYFTTGATQSPERFMNVIGFTRIVFPAGVIAGAAVDVFDHEPPLPADEPLLAAKNTLLTPHIAFASRESMSLRARIVFDNLRAFLDGAPVNVVR